MGSAAHQARGLGAGALPRAARVPAVDLPCRPGNRAPGRPQRAALRLLFAPAGEQLPAGAPPDPEVRDRRAARTQIRLPRHKVRHDREGAALPMAQRRINAPWRHGAMAFIRRRHGARPWRIKMRHDFGPKSHGAPMSQVMAHPRGRRSARASLVGRIFRF